MKYSNEQETKKIKDTIAMFAEVIRLNNVDPSTAHNAIFNLAILMIKAAPNNEEAFLNFMIDAYQDAFGKDLRTLLERVELMDR